MRRRKQPLTRRFTNGRGPGALVASVAGILLIGGCTQVSRVGLLSDGNLDGRSLANAPRGRVLQGEDCGMSYYLANAFRQATAGTEYDTMVDVEVTSTASMFPFGQCLKVKGAGVRSSDLPTPEGSR